MQANTPENNLLQVIESHLIARIKHNKISLQKLAATFGIDDKTKVKELTELAIVNRARAIALNGESINKQFEKIVALYNDQVNLSHRTSESILLQQYSTPAPIAFLMGLFCKLNSFEGTEKLAFEPSAGNGLLTIACPTQNVIVNELDNIRVQHLQTQNFKAVHQKDATIDFKISIDQSFEKRFDAVLSNPPFGVLDIPEKIENYSFKTLDHLMAINALQTLKDDGRAAIIIGGHSSWDNYGRIQAGKNRIFFNYLFSHYNVLEVLQINGRKLYTKQGTGFNVRLILIDGRKKKISGNAPLFDADKDNIIHDFQTLYLRISPYILSKEKLNNEQKKNAIANEENYSISDLEKKANSLAQILLDAENNFNGLGAPYMPASSSSFVLDTVVPDSMDFETNYALQRLKAALGGNIDAFVKQRLSYPSLSELYNALSAEQIDAIAYGIYNIEVKNQGMIIGDQTGIGKGRVAAAMIRYAALQEKKALFMTEKTNLFSDIYRDLIAIGSGHLVPFIVNAKESKTDVKDENGKVLYSALPLSEQTNIFNSKAVPGNFDFVLCTYSQINSAEKKPLKPNFLKSIAKDNIVIMDESHNSSGLSNTGAFMQNMIKDAQGVLYLSATFAKRADNMPIYAMKTAISEANMSKDELTNAVIQGGVALQEILAAQLVKEGQMIRRERSFEGVEVNYITFDDKQLEHQAIADNITNVLRDIIAFQKKYIDKEIEKLDEAAASYGESVETRKGTSEAGVSNQPYFSKVFNVIHQMLFSIKAEAVAERAIARLKEGKKPVIAFASTMGSFIEQMENDEGLQVSSGDFIKADFSEVLFRGLKGVLRYTEKDQSGISIHRVFEPFELGQEAESEYNRILDNIQSISTGISISPIDVIIDKITKAGFSVSEVTGRKYAIDFNSQVNKRMNDIQNYDYGKVLLRKKENANDAFRKFNNNQVDVLLINQAGSTGASAHAIPTATVPKGLVKQRVMLVLQAELDINTEVQKRGRINRTGQIYKPIYDYCISTIPAEMRLMMMLQKKLKSLDANTSSNQKQSNKILDVPDFLNKYGDFVVKEYLQENETVNNLLGNPLSLKLNTRNEVNSSDTNDKNNADAAHRVSGRVAVLSTKMQQAFYQDIAERYNDYVDYLKQTGEYDLEVEALNLEAETLKSNVVIVGSGGRSAFGQDSRLELIMANVLKKPFSELELKNIINESLGNQTVSDITTQNINALDSFFNERLDLETKNLIDRNQKNSEDLKTNKVLLRIKAEQGIEAYQTQLLEKTNALKHELETDLLKTKNYIETNRTYIKSLFSFFYIGRALKYPVFSWDGLSQSIDAVCIGFMIDNKAKNPYALSRIKLRIALANSQKYITLPCSYAKDIAAIKSESYSLGQQDFTQTLAKWQSLTKDAALDRTRRYVITGNLLQAFSKFHGKLISYTTHDKQIKKGILLPEYWQPEGEHGNFLNTNVSRILVPIVKAYKVISALMVGQSITTNSEISIFKYQDYYKIKTPSASKKAGDVFLDKSILKLMDKGLFERSGDKMVAILPFENLEAFLKLLGAKNTNVELTEQQFKIIQTDASQYMDNNIDIPLPKAKLFEQKVISNDLSLFELEAMALLLELELMSV